MLQGLLLVDAHLGGGGGRPLLGDLLLLSQLALQGIQPGARSIEARLLRPRGPTRCRQTQLCHRLHPPTTVTPAFVRQIL